MITRIIAAIAIAIVATCAQAQDRVTIQVGYSPGGGFDSTARLVADHLGRHIADNPEIVVENVPGAGSLKLAKQLMVMRASDDITLATVSGAAALRPIFNPGDDSFDPTAAHYVGALSSSSSYCFVAASSEIQSFEEALNNPDVKVGATGKTSATYQYPTAIKRALNGQFQIVTGFKGGNEINLAIERGDIDMRCGTSFSSLNRGDTLERVRVIGEMGLVRAGDLEGATFILDQLPEGTKRDALAMVFASASINHPYVLPPSTTPDQVAMMRKAFDDMVADHEFLADAQSRGIKVGYTSGEGVHEMIARYLQFDPDVRLMAREFVQ